MRRLASVMVTGAGLAGLVGLALWRELRLRADDARLGLGPRRFEGGPGQDRPSSTPS